MSGKDICLTLAEIRQRRVAISIPRIRQGIVGRLRVTYDIQQHDNTILPPEEASKNNVPFFRSKFGTGQVYTGCHSHANLLRGKISDTGKVAGSWLRGYNQFTFETGINNHL